MQSNTTSIQCRCNNREPTPPSAIGKIKDLHNIEHSIAVKNNTLDQHKTNRSCWNLCCNCALMSYFFHFSTTTVFLLWLRMSQLPTKLGYGQTQTSRENVEKTNVCNSHPAFYIFLHLTYKKCSWPYYYDYVQKKIYSVTPYVFAPPNLGQVIYDTMYLVTSVVGSGLVPEGTGLLPKPMLTYSYAIP